MKKILSLGWQKGIALCLVLLGLVSCASHKAVQQEPSLLSESQQRKYDYFFLEAIRLESSGEIDAAYELLQHCLEIDPEGASAYYELSRIYFFLNQSEEAIHAQEKAVELSPENYWYHQTLAEFYLQKNRLEDAAELLEKMSVRFPSKRGSLFTLLDVYKALGKHDQTIATLQRLEEIMGKSEELSMEKFNAYVQKEDKKKAFGEIEGLVAEYPLDLRYRVVLGNVYMMNGRTPEAYAQYQQVLDKEPTNVMAHIALANYYEYIGEDSLAQQEYEDNLLLNAEVTTEMKANIMRRLVAKNEKAKADSTEIINLFDKMCANDVDDDQIRMLYAQYLWAKKMEKQSEPVLNEILAIDPSNNAVRLMALQLALQNNETERVMKLCQDGVELYPQTMEYHFYLTLCYTIQGDFDQVIHASQKALDCATPEVKDEVRSDFYQFMGDAFFEKEQLEDAFAAYDKALEFNSKNVGVLNNYAYYLSLQKKDLDKAEAMSYQTIKAEPENGTYLDTYAWILFLQGDYTQAKMYIDQAMKTEEKGSAVIVEHCGDIYYKVGEVAEAVAYWKKALELGGGSKMLKRKIEKRKYIAE